MAAKQVIVLDLTDSGGYIRVNTAFWLPVTGTPIARTNAQSAWKAVSSQELADLAAGLFVEEINTFIYPHGTAKAVIQTNLIALYNARVTGLAALAPVNAYYGVFFDGTVWSA